MSDFEGFELVNLASDTAHRDMVESLHAQLRAHFEGDQASTKFVV